MGGQGGQQSQGGDYQQYMKQYAGDYQKYMGQGNSGSPTQLSASGGDYQQYMKQYAGDFMKQYAGDYQKYMKHGGGNATNNRSQIAEHYRKEFASQWMPDHQNMTQDEALKKWAGGYIPQRPKNASDSSSWTKAYMDQYAGKYELYTNKQPKRAPAEASECHNITELQAWRSSQLDEIKGFVPKDFQGIAQAKLQDMYDSNKQRIESASKKQSAGNHSKHADTTANAADEKSKPETKKPENADDEQKKPETKTPEASSPPLAFLAAKHSQDASEVSTGQATAIKDQQDASVVLAEQAPATSPVAALSAVSALVAFAGVAFFVAKRLQQKAPAEGYLSLHGEP